MQLTNKTTEPRSPYELERGTFIWHEDQLAIFLNLDELNGLATVQYLENLSMELVRISSASTLDVIIRAEIRQ